MAQTITGTIGTLVSLTTVSHDPTTITATGVLNAGLIGDVTRQWQVVNLWTIARTDGICVYLGFGGSVTNTGTASKITGSTYGIQVHGNAGTIVNSGVISG